ncbi:MAG: helix-turn-helix domain-containing protein, partial [Myxococcota bacterium]
WLPRYPFPGNVRELRNMVEQAVLLGGGEELSLDDFPVLSRMAAGWDPPGWEHAAHPIMGAGSAPPARLSSSVASIRLEPSGSTSAPAPATTPGGTAPARRFAGPPPPGSHPPTVALESRGSISPRTAAGSTSARPQGRGAAEETDPSGPPVQLDGIRRQAEARERQALVRALEDTGGNVSATARKLELSRYQVLRRIKKYGLR